MLHGSHTALLGCQQQLVAATGHDGHILTDCGEIADDGEASPLDPQPPGGFVEGGRGEIEAAGRQGREPSPQGDQLAVPLEQALVPWKLDFIPLEARSAGRWPRR